MAGLRWMAVTLAVFLSTGNSLAVDQNQLATIVQQVLNRYTPSYMNSGRMKYPMFSLAVSIPYNSVSRSYDLNQVPDTSEAVKNRIQDCNLYIGTRVVAATVLRWPDVLTQCPNGPVQWPNVLRQCPAGVRTWNQVKSLCPQTIRDGRADHAEYRTLQGLNTLLTNRGSNDLLLFYVLSSPCDKRCTSETSRWNILDSIQRITSWNNRAVVFSNVFKPGGTTILPENDLRGALERLGNRVGLQNIFRCRRRPGMQCTSCSTNGQVTPYCYSDNAGTGPSQNLPQGGGGGQSWSGVQSWGGSQPWGGDQRWG
ncbi:uncharacterized protein LOC111649339 [Seriola lalandi dorsalis]|uniref:uncharacterized protein LOC111649339 n=1 Tax=Seriola lalandi dorsalis TaxID=1841481 RepID=UPI000C6FC69A|nr:uncharacterized protein LOC111649339 [Seriola lalandi dorsalis]XP_056223477.1 uncharacterized protein LOC130163355 [Seriola aureovittata]XP_056223486.1 uncharacterized protein LOC130163355 [Seriola aureovittata]